MIEVKRPVTRVTTEIDYRTRKPLVIQLVPGGKLVRIKVKGERNWFTVTMKQLYMLGASNRASEIKAEKKARREERKKNK